MRHPLTTSQRVALHTTTYKGRPVKTYELIVNMRENESYNGHTALMKAESVNDLVSKIQENMDGKFFALKAKGYVAIINSNEVQDIIIRELEETPSNTSATPS